MVNFGERLRQLRKARGLTQAQLAELLGGSKMMISSYESGTRFPPYPTLVKIASIYGVTTDYLLGAEKHKTLNADGLSDDQLQLAKSLIDELRKANSLPK